jgi:hypothetical protein
VNLGQNTPRKSRERRAHLSVMETFPTSMMKNSSPSVPCETFIEAPWLVNGGHSASLRHHNQCELTEAPSYVSTHCVFGS